MTRRPRTFAILAFALVAAASPGLAQDLFIGTIEAGKDQVVLVRCDLGQNRYLLRDRAGQAALADLRARLKDLKAPVYVEVVGEYAEIDGGHALDVIALENVTPAKSCHLLDALPDAPSKAGGGAASQAD